MTEKWDEPIKPPDPSQFKSGKGKRKPLKEVEIECKYATDEQIEEAANLLEYGRLMNQVDQVTKGEEMSQEEGQQPDFKCKVCGIDCPVAPDPPGQAVCEDHCENHEYRYDKWRRGTFCVHCDKQQEEPLD